MHLSCFIFLWKMEEMPWSYKKMSKTWISEETLGQVMTKYLFKKSGTKFLEQSI